MSTLANRAAGALALFGAPVAAQPAPTPSTSVSVRAPTVRVAPYIEVEQVLVVPLNDGRGDVFTATGVAAGVGASVQTARTQLAADARYQHFFGYDNGVADQDIVTGLLRGRTELVPRLLALDGGALASRSTVGGLGAAIGGNRLGSAARIYSGYVGPELTTTAQGLALLAGYRFGYSRVEADFGRTSPLGGGLDEAVGALVPVGLAQESTSHTLYGSASAQPGRFPFGWTLSGLYAREDADPLDQRFEQSNVRLDLTQPVSRTLALVGSVGYEDIQISRRAALLDGTGRPVLDANAGLLTDPTQPRRLVYDVDGLIYDGGLLWRPSPRSSAELRVGHRYGGTIVTGAVNWQFSRAGALTVLLFDERDTFGRSLTRGLSRIPTNFGVVRGAFGNDLLGCAYAPGGQGACLDPLQTAFTGTSFRSRGVNALASLSRGDTSLGIGGGYIHRTFDAPDFGIGAAVFGPSDDTAYLNAFYNTRVGPRSTVAFDATGSLYDPNLPGGGDVVVLSGEGQYGYLLTQRLNASGALGLYYVDAVGFSDQVTAAARVALRYGF